jgi:HSP20 family molecular chaperone IbpA
LINPGYSATGVNVVIRTDLHFDSETSVLTALCELPGRSKSDVTVVLSTNALNRVKQVVVTAKSPQDIADDGYVLRERRSGNVSRTFVVPSETTVRWFFVLGVDICHVTLVLQPDDITVEMRDGLLSLKIQFPPPSSEDDSQEIAIR